MKITVDATQFKDACKSATMVVPRRTTLPVTRYVLLEAADGRITLRSTDLEKMVWATLQGNIEEEGELSVPLAPLRQFISKEKTSVAISLDDKMAVFEGRQNGDRATLRLRTAAAEGYDQVPAQTVEGDELNLGPDLSRFLGMALTHAATEESRPILTGVLIRADGNGRASMAAADGFRLFAYTWAADVPEFTVVLPGKSVDLISRFMKGEVKVVLQGPLDDTAPHALSRARFECDGLTMVTQLVQGQFPQHDQLIPKSPGLWNIDCSGPMLCQRLQQFTTSSGIIRLQKHKDEGVLSLSGRDEDVGEFEAAVSATLAGEGKIAVNQAYLAQSASFFATVHMEVTAPSSPIKMTGDIEGLTCVIMPMFVQW